jgi:citronellol/citronellal dehydrogenase
VSSSVFRDDLLAGQVAVVSGAGSGIGRATALELASLGASVIICGRRPEPLAETAALYPQGQLETVVCDIREEDQVDALVSEVLERHPRIHLLVNNAGGQFLAAAEDISPKGFRTVIRLNVEGTWLMTHAVATRSMIPSGGGKVVSITLSPHHGLPGMVHSAAARAAVENMMRTLAIEWARFGIKCTAVAPGQIATDTFMTKYPSQFVEMMSETVPAARLGTAEEIAWLVAYLASPAGDFITGTVLTVDGARDDWLGTWPPSLAADADGRPVAEQRRARHE